MASKDDSLLPTAGRYLNSQLKTQFQEAISQIISDLGREITFHLPPSESGCPNCVFLSIGDRAINRYNTTNPYDTGPYNKSFPDGAVCPVCRSTHVIVTPNTAVWRGTIFKKPDDYDYSQAGVSPENVLLTKTRIEAWEDIKNCSRATIDGVDYQRLSEPVKIGMGNLPGDMYFINTFWRRVT